MRVKVDGDLFDIRTQYSLVKCFCEAAVPVVIRARTVDVAESGSNLVHMTVQALQRTCGNNNNERINAENRRSDQQPQGSVTVGRDRVRQA